MMGSDRTGPALALSGGQAPPHPKGDDPLRQRLARTVHAPALIDAEVSNIIRGLAIASAPGHRAEMHHHRHAA